MSEHSHQGHGKISVHGDGLGAPTPETIERRAREIAMIDEREPNNFTEGDWDQARREMMGEDSSHAPEELADRVDSEQHEIIPESQGHRAPRIGVDDDDESIGERLVEGGIEEATHDQMVEARKELRERDEI